MQFKPKMKIFKFSKYCKIAIQLNVTVYTEKKNQKSVRELYLHIAEGVSTQREKYSNITPACKNKKDLMLSNSESERQLGGEHFLNINY